MGKEILSFIFVLLGLIFVVFSNNLMGVFNALAEGKFDKTVAKKGLIKASGIILALAFGYGAGMLVPDVSIGMVGGELLTMSQAVAAVVTAAYGVYGYKFIEKCVETLKIKIQPMAKDVELNPNPEEFNYRGK